MSWLKAFSLEFLWKFFVQEYVAEDYVDEDNPNPWVQEGELE